MCIICVSGVWFCKSWEDVWDPREARTRALIHTDNKIHVLRGFYNNTATWIEYKTSISWKRFMPRVLVEPTFICSLYQRYGRGTLQLWSWGEARRYLYLKPFLRWWLGTVVGFIIIIHSIPCYTNFLNGVNLQFQFLSYNINLIFYYFFPHLQNHNFHCF